MDYNHYDVADADLGLYPEYEADIPDPHFRRVRIETRARVFEEQQRMISLRDLCDEDEDDSFDW